MVVAFLVVAQLKSLMDTSGGAGWNGSTEQAQVGDQVDLYGGVATRIVDLTGFNTFQRHLRSVRITTSPISKPELFTTCALQEGDWFSLHYCIIIFYRILFVSKVSYIIFLIILILSKQKKRKVTSGFQTIRALQECVLTLNVAKVIRANHSRTAVIYLITRTTLCCCSFVVAIAIIDHGRARFKFKVKVKSHSHWEIVLYENSEEFSRKRHFSHIVLYGTTFTSNRCKIA